MDLKISGGGFGSVVDLLAGADLERERDATTTLDWKGNAHGQRPGRNRSAAACSTRRRIT